MGCRICQALVPAFCLPFILPTPSGFSEPGTVQEPEDPRYPVLAPPPGSSSVLPESCGTLG